MHRFWATCRSGCPRNLGVWLCRPRTKPVRRTQTHKQSETLKPTPTLPLSSLATRVERETPRAANQVAVVAHQIGHTGLGRDTVDGLRENRLFSRAVVERRLRACQVLRTCLAYLRPAARAAAAGSVQLRRRVDRGESAVDAFRFFLDLRSAKISLDRDKRCSSTCTAFGLHVRASRSAVVFASHMPRGTSPARARTPGPSCQHGRQAQAWRTQAT